MTGLDDLRLAGEVVGVDHEGWTAALRLEFERNAFNPVVGGQLLASTDRARVWGIRLAPGERLAAHRHVLDYVWTAITAGRSRQHTHDGTTRLVDYQPGDTRDFRFPAGHYLLHDLENIGTTELIFTTVEFLDSPNPPLPLPQHATAGPRPTGGLGPQGGDEAKSARLPSP